MIALALVALLVFASTAQAAVTRPVQAVDTESTSLWTPQDLRAQPGDTIEWRLTQPGNPAALNHDVWLVAPGAANSAGDRVGGTADTPVATRVVEQTGTYGFYCSVHPESMRGTVAVDPSFDDPVLEPGAAVDTGPPAAPNTSSAPTVFEEGDNLRPVMDLRVSRAGRLARVRVRVSEAGTLYVRLLRGRRELSTRRVRIRAGMSRTSVRLPRRAGRYRLAVWARDAGGLESKWRYTSVRVSSS
jgi:plastocyanin